MFKKQKPAELPVPKIIKKPAPAPPVPPKESTETEQPAAENVQDDEESTNEDSKKSKATIQEASKTTISTVQDENTQVTDSFVSVSFATGQFSRITQIGCPRSYGQLYAMWTPYIQGETKSGLICKNDLF